MTMVGGFDVHRQQITFDYVDDDGLVRWGQIRPATRKTLRGWLAEHCPDGDAEFALEGCTGWRYVVEELAAAGVGLHLGDPAEIATARGPKKRAKTDRADARLLRTLLLQGRFPESWIPPAHVLEIRTPGPVVLHPDGRAAGLATAHPRPVVPPGLPTDQSAAVGSGPPGVGAAPSYHRPGGSTSTRRCGASMSSATEIEPLRTQLVNFAQRQTGCRALQAPLRHRVAVRGDHLGRDR